MTFITETVRLSRSDVPSAAPVLARAFFDDPLFTWLEPDDAQRSRALSWIMQIGANYGALFGELHATAQPMLGGAVWLPPGETKVLPERMEQAGFIDPVAALGETGLARFGAFMDLADELHGRDMDAPHWYLMILGVDPPFQGQGIGSGVISAGLAQADRERLPCYLETAKERNLAFYRKHGFDVVHDGTMPDSGPRFWTMRREPRG